MTEIPEVDDAEATVALAEAPDSLVADEVKATRAPMRQILRHRMPPKEQLHSGDEFLHNQEELDRLRRRV